MVQAPAYHVVLVKAAVHLELLQIAHMELAKLSKGYCVCGRYHKAHEHCEVKYGKSRS